jgi:transcriptional regulator with XRE-family HTH domain
MRSKVSIQFGARLKRLRQGAGLSQEQLAQLASLDRSYVGSVERGERNVSLENICCLARALKVPPSSLFEDRQDKR